jgi:hypothetical protein
MPDPDRGPGDRWQSDAYRNHFRDSRYAYRMNPDRFENQFDGRRDVDREMQMRWNRDARDREYADYGREWDRGGYGESRFAGSGGGEYDRDRGYERSSYGHDYGFGGRGRAEWGQGTGWGADRSGMGRGMDRGMDRGMERDRGMDRGWDRGMERDRYLDRGPHYDRDRIYGSDRGWDRHDERDRGFYDDDWRRRR